MLFRWLLILFLVSGCELLDRPGTNFALPVPDLPPKFEFSYHNSTSFAGWIRYRNHCRGIVSYKWYLGFNDATGQEATSFSSAPKVQYPQNGTYRVIVQGVDADDKTYEQIISVTVSNY